MRKRRNVRYRRRKGRYSRRFKRFTRRVKRAVNRIAEKKFVTNFLGTNSAPIGIASDGTTWINPLAAITSGSSRGQRIGNRIFVKRIIIRFRMTVGVDSTVTQEPFVRYTFGFWKNTFNTVNGPGSLGYLEGDNLGSSAFRFLQPIDPDKFRAKKDKMMHFGFAKTTAGGLLGNSPTSFVKKYVWKVNKTASFDDNNTTIADVIPRMALIWVSNTGQVNLWCTVSTYYTDV